MTKVNDIQHACMLTSPGLSQLEVGISTSDSSASDRFKEHTCTHLQQTQSAEKHQQARLKHYIGKGQIYIHQMVTAIKVSPR